MDWHKVMDTDDLWEGDMVGVGLGAVEILLVKVGDELRAYENRCPHQATPLSDGDLEAGVLTCSAHLWEFDACSGAGINPAGARLVEYPVRIDDGVITVGLPRAP
jgi:toluene monooxygenase system ferredoxin subunit